MSKKQKKSISESNDEHEGRDSNSHELSPIFRLNEDCLMYIFSFLSIPERVRLQRVCKHWLKVSTLPWTDMKKLDISYFPSQNKTLFFTPPILKQVLKLCGSSLTHFEQRLDYTGTWRTTTVLAIISKMCPNIRSLKITVCKYSSTAVECLVENFTKLTSFAIGDCLPKHEDLLSNFFSNNKQLKSVEFCDSRSRLTGTCLLSLPVDTIESIYISGCSRFVPDHLEKILPTCTKLHSLIIKDNVKLLRRFDYLLDLIPSKSDFQNLTFRDYRSVHYKPPNCTSLRHFKNLRVLNLQGERILTDKMLKTIAKYCTKLSHVTLSNSARVRNPAMRCITNLPDLEYLELQSLNEIKKQPLQHMPKLKVLKCTECNYIDTTNLSFVLETSENLEYCLISDCENIDIQSLIEDAKKATDGRENDVTLELCIRTEERQPRITKYSPRLRIVEEPTLWIYNRPY